MPMATSKSASNSRPRRRSKVGAAPTVRVYTPEPRRKVKASRRAYLQLYMPRFTFNPWHSETAWRASRSKFFATVFFVVLAVALYQLFSNSLFFVDNIAFGGNRFATREELTRASGIQGWNIFFINTGEVEAALKKMPEVKEAHVTLGLPNRVQVQIVERLPRFVWETRGQTYWVDDDGLAVRARTSLPGLLWVKDMDANPVQIGERVNVDAFNAVVSLHNAWPKGPRVFEWSRTHGLAVREDHGWLVYLGNANQMPEKLAALNLVRDQISKEKKTVSFIDVGSGLPYYQEVVVAKK